MLDRVFGGSLRHLRGQQLATATPVNDFPTLDLSRISAALSTSISTYRWPRTSRSFLKRNARATLSRLLRQGVEPCSIAIIQASDDGSCVFPRKNSLLRGDYTNRYTSEEDV